MATIRIVKKHSDAVIPTRAYENDIGLDLTAIKKHKVLENGVILYDTGIAISPPNGYYIEIVPRSSLSKTGWMLANSIGTIDPSYTGNLYIALIRVIDGAPELDLPFCRCQIIVRKAEYFEVEEVENLNDTVRGSGGFGSTDKIKTN